MLYCGVDPGLKGAICLLDDNAAPVFYDRMPLNGARKMDARLLYETLYKIERISIERMENVSFAIEKAITMPSDVENIDAKIDAIYKTIFSTNPNQPTQDIKQMFAELSACVKKRDGRVGVLSIGINYGIILGAVGALGWRCEIVPARTWQSQIWKGIHARATSKEKTYLFCRQMWPEMDFKFAGMKLRFHDGLCDAFAIAEYNRQKNATAKGSIAAAS